jgi:hypothetical protein
MTIASQPLSETDRHAIADAISDLSKSAQGFRTRINPDAMTDAELQAEIEYWQAESERAVNEEQEAFANAKVRFDAHIAGLMSAHAIDYETAVRWDMQAEGCREIDAYLYEKGLNIADSNAVAAKLGHVTQHSWARGDQA